MKIRLMLKLYRLKFRHIIHDTNASMHQQVPCTRKKIISLGSQLIACCKLAPTLARQMWRHNYVVDRNEYLIFRLTESTNLWVYSLQFLFKSTNNSWSYERKCEWVFFFWTQCSSQITQFINYRLLRVRKCWQGLTPQHLPELCWQVAVVPGRQLPRSYANR